MKGSTKRYIPFSVLIPLSSFLLACLFGLSTLSAQTQLGADINGEAAGDQLGSSVAMSSDGSRVAIGAINNDGTGTNAGHVRVFSWSGSAWTQLGADINGEAAGDAFGSSVSLSDDGNRLAVGGPNNDGTGTNAGHVRVFSWNGSAWTQLGTDINGEAADDAFGGSVSLSDDGNRLAVGGPGNSGNGGASGHVRVFSWSGSAWTQLGADINGGAAGDLAGRSVSLSSDGSRVAIGEDSNDDNGISAGQVRVFSWNGSAWAQTGMDLNGEATDDRFGFSVGLSSDGTRLSVGAYNNDGSLGNAGHVRVFSWNGSTWSQMGADINGEFFGDQSGWSHSLSSDGSRVAIGAFGNDGNGSNAGHVRVYSWSGSAWAQLGTDMNGEALGDYLGWSVAISPNGNRVAAGAIYNSGNGANAGHVRVYQLPAPCPATGSVWYVDASAASGGNGSSWACAFQNLQDAINAASSSHEIWVKTGTYLPTLENGGTGDRYKTFLFNKNVKIYGGFAGTETLLSQRDWTANSTILSGNVGTPSDSDNAYHVVTTDGLASTATLDGFTVKKGQATGNYPLSIGAGVYNSQSALVFANCNFTENNANGNGGGIYNTGSGSSPTLTNCIFSGNSANWGGGIHNAASGASPTLTNCLFYGNLASVYGGGVYGSAYLTNCTVSGNTAFTVNSQGGGLWGVSALTNCIVWNNKANGVIGSADANIHGLPTITYSLIQNWNPSGAGNLDGIANAADSNYPDFVTPFVFGGGLAGDFHIQTGSPAANAGTNTGAPTVDLFGTPRPSGSSTDMGVHELPEATCPAAGSVWYVDAAAASGGTGSSWACAFQNLQDAIDAASSDHEIWVKTGTYKPTKDPFGNASPANPRDKTFYLKDGVAIYGGFAGTETMRTQRNWTSNTTILSGDIGTAGVNTDNCYHVVVSVSDANTTELDGFTVSGGNADSGNSLNVESQFIRHNLGGGMFNVATSVKITNCTFSGNFGQDGGAMRNSISGSPSLTNCNFYNNTAGTSGGGVFNHTASPTLTGCTFSGNIALGGDGGGVLNESCSPTLLACVFSNNSASATNGYGGGMANYNSPAVNLTNCLFSGNYTLQGGALYLKRSGVNLTNCTFSGNRALGFAGNISADLVMGSLTLKNCLIWNNRIGSTTGSADANLKVDNGSPTITYSLIQDWNPAGTGNLNGITNASDSNYPSFVTPLDPATAPSTAGDFRLTVCSPVLNVGTNTGAPTTDLFGNARPFGANVDMGVYELQSASSIPNAGADQTGASTCGFTTVTLAANTPSVGTGAWSVVSGTGGSFGNASSSTSTFSGTAGTAYQLRWTISNASCTTLTDDVNVTFNQSPTVANAGADQTGLTACGTSTVTLAANTPTVGTGMWSVVSGLGGSVVNPSSPTSTFFGFLGPGGIAYQLRWTIANAPCPTSTDDINVTFNQNPTVANAGADQTGSATCGLTTVTLAANTPTVGIGSWSVVSGTGGSFANASSPTSTFSGTAGTAYQLRWTISNAPCTASTDDVSITFNRNPTLANAGPDQTGLATCGLTTVTLAANTPSVGTGAWSVVSGAGGSFANASSPTSTFTGTAGTAYVLRWTISNAPCTASTDDVNVTFNRNPTTANAGSDQTGFGTCGLTTVNLLANTPSVGTGAWSVVSGTGGSFGNASSPTSTFSGTAGTAYVLRWTISTTCASSTDDVNVTFKVNPTMSCPSNTTVEDDDPAFALSGATPTGGTYSGTGVSSGNFNPATAGLGTHTITYTYTSPSGCSGTCTFAITVVSGCPAAGAIWYVDGAAAPGGTGTSWACAFQNVQDAINAASSGHEVWVKAGTYKPTKDPFGNTSPTDPRDKTFYLKNGVAVYGGFAGTETARTQRNWTANVTTLSGDIGTVNVNSDNCYHVVLSVSDGGTTVLDGFTVEKGNANGSDYIDVESFSSARSSGGGMHSRNASITIANCKFSGNSASDSGGGIFNNDSSPNLTDCTFSGNSATYSGGGMINIFSSSTLTRCAFSNNSAGYDGGGLSIQVSTLVLTGCTFTACTSSGSGGGVNASNSSATLNECEFTGNSAAGQGGGMMNVFGSSLELTNCKFSGNSADLGGGGMYNHNSATTMTNCTLSGNKAGNSNGGGMAIKSTILVMSNCIIWNNRAETTTGSAAANLSQVSSSLYIGNSLIQNQNPGSGENLDGVTYASLSNYPDFVTPLDPATAPSTAGDFHIGACSPVINRGWNTGPPNTDLFGNARPFGTALDLGVHEFQSAPTPATATCQNTTVQLDGAGNGTLTASVLDNGSTGCVPLAFSASKTTFNCADLGANTVTLTVTGLNGATATCNATVTVVDQVAPNALCRDIVKNLGANGMATVTVAEVDNLSNDNCGTVNLLGVSPSSFACANIGTNTVTLTVNDGHGNTSTCNATVTVADNTAPTALCQNVSANLSGNSASVTASQINNGSTDNCGTANLSLSATTFTCANVGSNSVVLTVNDGHGNSSTCAATVTVVDNTNPTALCQNVSVNLNGSGTATVAASQVNNGSSDACGIASLVLSATSFTCANVGSNPVTLTVTDNNGRTATCTATVTVSDNANPMALCQNVTVNLDQNGNASLAAAQVDGGSSDNCGIAMRSVTPNAFTVSNIGPNTVTLTVTDNNARTASCTATVTVTNTNLPNAVCQPYTVSLNGAGTATIAAANVDGGSSAVGGIQSLGVLPNTFNCSNLGANTVTLTVTGNNGLTATCSAAVTVQDNTAPAVVCQDISVNLNGNGANITAAQVLDTGASTDNCGTVAAQSVSPSTFTCSNLGPNTVMLTANDGHGNTATCAATVTVNDNTPPTALCQKITVNLGAGGMASVSAAQVNNASTDNCGTVNLVGVSPNSFACANIGPNTVTLTVNDGNGNAATCAATVTVRDNTAPTALCRDVVLQLDANGNAALTAAQVNNGSSDNCALGTLSVAPNAFTLANLGLNTVTLTVPDANGNSATCTAQVTVENNQLPNAVCQNITRSLGANGQVSVSAADIDGGSTALGGIANRVASPNLLNCGNIGTNTVALTITGNNGRQASCNATVTVNDATAPTAVCQNAAVNLDAGGNATVAAAQINNNSTDNCGTVNLVGVAPASIACANLGANTVTLTVNDGHGNTATCNAVVTVSDNTAPGIVCPANQTVTGNANCQGTMGSYAAMATKSDNCSAPGNISVSQIPASGGLFTGSQTVTLTATDGSNNTSTCAFTVSVVDNTAPTIVCPANQTVSADATCQGTVGNYVALATKSDNCSAPGSINVAQSPLSGTPIAGTTTVTLTATDAANNSANCIFSVSIRDVTPPTVGCPDNQTVTGNATCQGTLGDYVAMATKSDNCSAPGNINVSQTPASGGLFAGSQTVTLTASDFSENTATCAFTVSVVDNTAPTIVCPANQTVSADATCQGTVGNYVALATKSDNCTAPGSINVAQSPLSGTPIAGTTTVTLTATDAANNSANCIFSVSIRDVTPPTVGCPANQTVTGNATCQGTLGDYVALATKSDNCSAPGNIGVSQTPASGGLFTGSQTVTLTATDGSNNTATCAFTVSVVDNTTPTITCPANQTVSADPTCQGTVGNYTALATKSDNCSAPGSINVAQSPISGTPIAGTTTVTLTATDAANNSANCILSVSIRDVTPPTVGCPANQTVTGNATCQGTLGDYVALATKSDNCSAPANINVTQSPASGGLFTGSQMVTLTASDFSENTATCVFTVTVTDNTAPTIVCPANQTVSADPTCQGTVGDYVALATKSDNCTAPGSINVAQSPLSGTPIAGTTTVTLTATDAANNSATCVFSVSIRDVTPPTVGCPANQTVTANANCQGVLGSYAAMATKSDNCSAPGNIGVSQTPASGGLFAGSQTVTLTASDFSENTATCVFTVTVTDNTAPTVTCPANQTVSADPTCQGTVGNYVALATKSDNCSVPGSINVAQSPISGTIIAGTTTVTLTATDAANNSATCAFSVSIRDVTPPTVVCPANKTVSATTNVPCTAVVNGIDAAFSDLCSSVSLAYALTDATAGGNNGQASDQTFQAGSTTVTYTATDGTGLSASCAFTVYVNPCQVTFTGTITWKQDNATGVKDATVTVTGDRNGSTTTATNGTYSLTLDPGSNFVLTPSKNLSKLNGVNAQDVQRLQQHLSGGLITNPWQLIAADVNGNNMISALDANILQLALLGNPSALDQMPKSWRFVPKTHAMASPPWGFPENIVLTGAAGTVNNLDFWGLKVGDLVATYANPANSTGQPLVLTARDESLAAGQTLAVDVTAAALRDLNALQLALRFDPEYLQLSDLQALDGLPLTKENFGTYQSAEGSVRVVWSGAQSVALRAGAPLFRLQFVVLEGGPSLSEVLRLDDETLLGQVFNSNGSASGVSLRFEGVTAVQNPIVDSPRAQLLQNQPNPFTRQTTIGFNLPEACEAQLRIVGAGGRVVAERRNQYPAGRNEERFDLQTAPGVLYYELTTPFGVLARKMVVVE